MSRGLGLKHFSVLFWKTLLQSNNLFTMKLVVNLLHNISAGQIRFLQLDQVSSVRLISSCYVCKVNQVQQTHLSTKQIFRLVLFISKILPNTEIIRERNLSPSKVVTFLYVGTYMSLIHICIENVMSFLSLCLINSIDHHFTVS